MRIIKRETSEQAQHYITEVVAILETIPIQAFGNSAEGVEKMAKVYDDLAELAYITGGIEGLNECITQFNKRARSMDEIMAVSKAHLKSVARHTKRRNKK